MNNDFDYASGFENFKRQMNSSENRIICEPFQQECQRFAEIAREYESMESYLCNQAQDAVVREEYAVKGNMIHRGYYSPSPIIDIVIGNCNRGKLLKRLTKKSNVTFNYGFDLSGRLIVVKSFIDKDIATTEFINYYDNCVMGVTFSSDHLITQLCEEVYKNKKLELLSQVSFVEGSNEIFDLHRESYNYDTLGISIANVYMYNPYIPLLSHDQYRFEHDDSGYLSNYTVKEFDGKTTKNTIWDNHVFDVRIKRRI